MAPERPRLRVGVELEALRRRASPGSWLVTWRLRNGGARPLTVIEAWHPHGRSRSSRLRRSLRVAARGSATIEVPARVDAAPGDAVENCFLILRAVRGRERWRILARFTLLVDEDGTPRPRVEAVDVHAAER